MKELTLQSPITDLKGIGKTRAEAFARVGVFCVRDLLFHFPKAYENRGDIRLVSSVSDDTAHAFSLIVATQPKTAKLPRHMSITKFRAFDESGTVEVVFFNQPYTSECFAVGDEYRFYGKLTYGKKYCTLTNPIFEKQTPGVPLRDMASRYALTDGLSNKIIASAIEAALPALSMIKDFLPENIRQKYEFPALSSAIKALHNPPSQDVLRRAFDRMAFQEYFTFSLGLSLAKKRPEGGISPSCAKQNIRPLLALLPYELTEAQKRAIKEIAADMRGEASPPMNRILVGDVGCGKTICAAIAAYIAVLNGHQAAIMAPTEILARQHYREFLALFERLGVSVSLLLGATPQREKSKIYASLTAEGDGRTDILIGTHALLNEKLSFADLGLTVTDEQHRFGVAQRTAIREKNPNAHLLVMSATPIPRTLALVLYGDLDISRIDEMPKGRQRVETLLIEEALRPRLNGFIRKTVQEGGQVYIVCPAIEEEEEDGAIPLEKVFGPTKEESPPLKAAVSYTEQLIEVFPEYNIAYLHGRMKPAEKDSVMQRFSDGSLNILVSTTVIEVGVNVPNASLMIVENAERFGLSQLHQLRGRVGRGTRKSYCILISDAKGELTKRRLQALCKTYDGYAIAEEDLQLRGPGDFFATNEDSSIRQSGGLRFSPLALAAGRDIMEAAFREATLLLSEDFQLTNEKNRPLAEEIARLFPSHQNTFS